MPKHLQELIDLNNKFYTNISKEFSDSRANSWQGWNQLIDLFKNVSKSKRITVLDLGCGNGRFYEFLNEHISNFKYIGLDSNSEFIKIANEKKYKNAQFILHDILKDGCMEYVKKADFICAFGLMHHLPYKIFRESFLDDIFFSIKTKAYFIFTIWDFLKIENLETLEKIKNEKLAEFSDLEEGDYFLNWNNSGNYRFCHHFNDNELHEMETTLYAMGLMPIKKFKGDGRTLDLNTYFVYQSEII